MSRRSVETCDGPHAQRIRATGLPSARPELVHACVGCDSHVLWCLHQWLVRRLRGSVPVKTHNGRVVVELTSVGPEGARTMCRTAFRGCISALCETSGLGAFALAWRAAEYQIQWCSRHVRWFVDRTDNGLREGARMLDADSVSALPWRVR